LQRGQKMRVRCHGAVTVPGTLLVVGGEAPGLFAGVGQFLIAVGQLQAAVVNLEAPRHRHTVLILPHLSQRRRPGGEVGDHGERGRIQCGFHLCRHQEIHRLTMVQTVRRAGLGGGGHQRRWRAGQRIQPGDLGEQVAERADHIGPPEPPTQQRQTFVDQLFQGEFGPIPLQHGEFRIVAGAGLTVTEYSGQLVDRAAAGGQQPLHVVLRRALQPAVAGHFDAMDVRVGDAVSGQGGGFHLQHATGIKKSANRAQKLGARFHGLQGSGGLPDPG